jgi:hypothetical protein
MERIIVQTVFAACSFCDLLKLLQKVSEVTVHSEFFSTLTALIASGCKILSLIIAVRLEKLSANDEKLGEMLQRFTLEVANIPDPGLTY